MASIASKNVTTSGGVAKTVTQGQGPKCLESSMYSAIRCQTAVIRCLCMLNVSIGVAVDKVNVLINGATLPTNWHRSIAVRRQTSLQDADAGKLLLSASAQKRQSIIRQSASI